MSGTTHARAGHAVQRNPKRLQGGGGGAQPRIESRIDWVGSLRFSPQTSGPYLSGPVRTVPDMSSERFEMRVPCELLARVDAARGHEPRASFVKRAVEAFLDDGVSFRSESDQAALRRAWDNPELEAQLVAPPATSVVVERAESGSGCPQCGGSWVMASTGNVICEDCMSPKS